VKYRTNEKQNSDLHVYRGLEPAGTGFIMGHELTGEVVEVGDAVKSVSVGDVVVSAFTTSWYVSPPSPPTLWLPGMRIDLGICYQAGSVSTALRASRPGVIRMRCLGAMI
jgi:NADPH:quinone reductase-like Zn-dependent oxidoreductase